MSRSIRSSLDNQPSHLNTTTAIEDQTYRDHTDSCATPNHLYQQSNPSPCLTICNSSICCASLMPPFAFFDSKIIALLVGLLLSYIVPLCYHLQQARASGLHYVVVPFHTYNFMWSLLIGKPLLGNFYKGFDKITGFRVTNSAVTSHRRFLNGFWSVSLRYAPFAELGDSFLIVAPGGIIFNTVDADVITSIINQPSAFPKPTHLYERIAIYGQNVVSAGGAIWKRHRKLTSPAFAEANNRLVWQTTLQCTEAMVTSWIQSNTSGQINLQQLKESAMNLSLEVIGKAALGQELGWINDKPDGLDRPLPLGHKMAFATSLKHVCANVAFISILLNPVIRFITFCLSFLFPKTDSYRKHLEAYQNWLQYMKEMVLAKKHSVTSTNDPSSIDIISQLINGQGIRRGLNDEEVIGNLFLFVIAGHETSASSILLCILLLALHPTSQQAVQAELDKIFNGRTLSECNYETDLPRLLNGTLGAVLNEQLRLQSPTPSIPKMVTTEPILINGHPVVLPPTTIIRICQQGVHMNSSYWPLLATPQVPAAFDHNDQIGDLGEFKPERWVTAEGPNGFKPRSGSFLPFSLGQRNCLGKRFAQIEIVAALAVIFSQFSIELDLSAVVSDEDLDNMGREEKRGLWEKVEGGAQREWRTKVTCGITV